MTFEENLLATVTRDNKCPEYAYVPADGAIATAVSKNLDVLCIDIAPDAYKRYVNEDGSIKIARPLILHIVYALTDKYDADGARSADWIAEKAARAVRKAAKESAKAKFNAALAARTLSGGTVENSYEPSIDKLEKTLALETALADSDYDAAVAPLRFPYGPDTNTSC